MEKRKVSVDELEALIGEFVMSRCPHRELEHYSFDTDDNVDCRVRCKQCGGEGMKTHRPRYARNANAAFEVVEKLASRDYGVKLSYHPMGGLWTCRFEIFECFTCYHGRASENWCQGDCNKASRKDKCVAICIATLATKGIFVEVE